LKNIKNEIPDQAQNDKKGLPRQSLALLSRNDDETVGLECQGKERKDRQREWQNVLEALVNAMFLRN